MVVKLIGKTIIGITMVINLMITAEVMIFALGIANVLR